MAGGQAVVSYGNSSLPTTNTATVPATLTTSEVDLIIVTKLQDLCKSQLTIYGGVTLGGVASATFYYYLSPDNGTTWFPISLYATATGVITQRAVVVDATTYATGGVSRFADNVPLGASTAFKVTGKSATGTPTLTNIVVMLRDN